MSTNVKQSSGTGGELRDVARRTGSFASVFRMMSGSFRSRVTAALESAAVLDDDRQAILAQRASLQESLDRYREALKATGAKMEQSAASAADTLRGAEATQAEVLTVQKRALAQEQRDQQLAAESGRLQDLSEDLARTQHEARELLDRVRSDASQSSALLEQTREEQTASRTHAETVDSRAAAVDAQAAALTAQERDVADREARVAATEGVQAAEGERLGRMRQDVDQRGARLDELLGQVKLSEETVATMEASALERIEESQRLQSDVAARFTDLERRSNESSARDAALAEGTTALDERKLALDRERVELDGRIAELSGLERRDEQLLQIKSHLDAEKKRLDEASDDLRAKLQHTLNTWEQLKDTLARLEQLEARVQTTYEEIRAHREETEARAESTRIALDEREGGLDERSQQLEMWRMEAQLRERRIQERFNELDELAKQKNEIRDQILTLEREHAERIASWDREQQRQRTLWAERRAEAEKARELYESNNDLLRVRLDDVVGREKEHVARAGDLDERDKQLARRALELEAMEAQVHELREQRQSLNSTIASLTARAGQGFSGIALEDAPGDEG